MIELQVVGFEGAANALDGGELKEPRMHLITDRGEELDGLDEGSACGPCGRFAIGFA